MANKKKKNATVFLSAVYKNLAPSNALTITGNINWQSSLCVLISIPGHANERTLC